MKAKAFKIVNLILAVIVCLFVLGNAFAWFAEDWEREQNFNGSSGSPYFERGTGTSDDPFIISTKYHMYNLAWLQNTGRLTEKYYFQIKDEVTELDLSDFWLPPIGTDDYPFKGVFNGNGKAIKNLKVTTDINKLTSKPAGSNTFSNAVGMFGMTAEGAEIKNFNLISPVVEVDKDNATYASGTSSATAGIAIGYANCGASKIGVYNGKLNVEKTGYTTLNSIVGGYDPEKVDGSGIDPESGSAYGSSMDLQKLFTELGNTTNSDGKGLATDYALPFLHDSSDSYATGATVSSKTVTVGETVNNITSGSLTIGYEFSSPKEVSMNYAQTKTASDNNIGYFTGSDMKGYYKSSVSYDNFYYPNITDPLPQTVNGVTYNAPSEDIKNYLSDEASQRGRYLLRSSSNHRLNQLYKSDGYILINEGRIGSYKGEVLAPVRSIWVAPVNAGTLRIVLVNPDNASVYVTIVKLTRSTPKDYSTYFSKVEAVFGDMSTGNNATNDCPLESGKAYYFEIEVTQEDIDEGYEYAIVNNGTGPYFAYLDLGTSGEEGGGSETSLPTLKNIDFIYDDGSNNMVSFDTDGWVATNVVIKFTTAEITLLYFYRPTNGKDSDGYTLEVQYSGTAPTATTSSGGKQKLTANSSLTFP